MNTIQEAKQFLKDNFKKGTTCPCCGQGVKLYTRPIYGSQAVSLINLYRISVFGDRSYKHISDFNSTRSGGGDFAKLRYWGLAQEAEGNNTSKRTSGMWAITQKGIDWVEGKRSVERSVSIFNQTVIGFSDDFVFIKDVLGDKFDYEELMRGLI